MWNQWRTENKNTPGKTENFIYLFDIIYQYILNIKSNYKNYK